MPHRSKCFTFAAILFAAPVFFVATQSRLPLNSLMRTDRDRSECDRLRSWLMAVELGRILRYDQRATRLRLMVARTLC